MRRDAILIFVLIGFLLVGARRGALTAGTSVVSLLIAYAGGIYCAQRLSGAVAVRLGISEITQALQQPRSASWRPWCSPACWVRCFAVGTERGWAMTLAVGSPGRWAMVEGGEPAEARARLILREDPEMQQRAQNPEIISLLEDRNTLALINRPKIQCLGDRISNR